MKTIILSLAATGAVLALSNCTTNVQPAPTVVNPPVTATTTTQTTSPYTGSTTTTRRTTTTAY